jgi:AraC-like DNA-binding protein
VVVHEPAALYRSVVVPGVTVARYQSTGVLYAGIKQRHSVSLVEAGWSEWWFEGRTYRSGPGSLLVRWRGGVHRDLIREGPTRFQVITFDPSLVSAVEEALAGRAAGGPAVVDPRRPQAAALRRLHETFRAEPRDALTAGVMVAEALSAFAEVLGEDAVGVPARRFRAPVRRARALIEDSIGEEIDLETLARHAGLDRFHLCRAFRAEVGLPPHAYRTHLRVSRARQLLADGIPAGSVAAKVGFFDQSQLTRHFKRIVGMTPGRYARALHARPR